MALNPIALLAQTPELDPLVPAQRQAQIEALAQQREQRGLALEQARQTAADDAAARAAFASNPTDAAARLRALAGVSPRAYATEAKSQSDIAKANAETRAKQLEAAHKSIDLASQEFGFVRDNPTLENANRALIRLEQNGIYSPEQLAQMRGELAKAQTPQDIASLATQAFQAAVGSRDQLPKIETGDIGGQRIIQSVSPIAGKVQTLSTTQKTQTPESIASNETARRGQDVAAATARRGQDLTQGAPQYDTERGVLVDRRTGTARQVTDASGQPIGTKEKPLTEFQGKSAAFADRALLADQALSKLDYSPSAINSKAAAGRTPLVGGILEAGANALLSPENQQAEQAQRDFVNAVLRQESGAAIGANEFDNARKQYFPQPGDSQEVIAQKAANRKTAIAGLQRNAGASYKAPSSGGTPAKNTKGWALHVDANGNRAYVSPDGTQFEEVR